MLSTLKYGLLLGLLMSGLGTWAPQPAGWIMFWTAVSVQSAVGTWITWRRLRLPWFQVGGVAALVVSLAMIPISARGLTLATIAAELSLPAVVAIWLGLLVVPLTIGLESCRNSPEWRAWSARMERASLWEMITFRHVPDMRRSGQQQ